MPSADGCGLHIIVNGSKLEEHAFEGSTYVEMNLATPVSYSVQECDDFNGQEEMGSWPVTPFQIMLRNNTSEPLWGRVEVDGRKVLNDKGSEV